MHIVSISRVWGTLFKYNNTYITINICSMIIIMYCSVSSILTKTVINTYVAAYMHSQVKHYSTYICT